MHPIEQRIYDDNLRTAWALASEWTAEHQAQLADLVVERFLRHPERSCDEVIAVFPQICLRLAAGVQS